jgi:hypothetical protein
VRVSKSQLSDVEFNVDLIWDLLALLKEIGDLLTYLPELFLDTLNCVSLNNFAIFG